jgi:hypothetical protein
MSHSTSSDPSHSPKITPKPRHDCCSGKIAANAPEDTKHTSHDCCDPAQAAHVESQSCEPGSSREAKKPSAHGSNDC